MLEKVRSHLDIKLISNRRQLSRLASRSTFKRYTIFNENLVGMEMRRSNVLMNRPIYVGFAILELSKLLMYEFHYDHMKQLYPGPKSYLLYQVNYLARKFINVVRIIIIILKATEI